MSDDSFGNTDAKRPFATPAINEISNKQQKASRKLLLQSAAGRNDKAFLLRSLLR